MPEFGDRYKVLSADTGFTVGTIVEFSIEALGTWFVNLPGVRNEVRGVDPDLLAPVS